MISLNATAPSLPSKTVNLIGTIPKTDQVSELYTKLISSKKRSLAMVENLLSAHGRSPQGRTLQVLQNYDTEHLSLLQERSLLEVPGSRLPSVVDEHSFASSLDALLDLKCEQISAATDLVEILSKSRRKALAYEVRCILNTDQRMAFALSSTSLPS